MNDIRWKMCAVAVFLTLCILMAYWMNFLFSLDSTQQGKQPPAEQVTVNKKLLEQIKLPALVYVNEVAHLATYNSNRVALGMMPLRYYDTLVSIDDLSQAPISVTTSGDPKFMEQLLAAITPTKPTTK